MHMPATAERTINTGQRPQNRVIVTNCTVRPLVRRPC